MPGDGGSRVNIPGELQDKAKESFKINQFNPILVDPRVIVVNHLSQKG